MTPADVARARPLEEGVMAAARFVLGEDFRSPSGVLQTAAITRGGDVLRIGQDAPKSAWDFFLLNLARASADVIVTTGKILRDEPTLRYDLEGELSGALHAYRRERTRRDARADVVILSSGRALDLDHPALHGWARPVLAMPDDSSSVAREAYARGVEVIVLADLSLRSLVETLASRAGCISIEAGPSSARALYDAPSLVSELWLSRFEGEIRAAARGLPFPNEGAIRDALGAPRSETKQHEPSGPWTFRRYVR